MMSPQIKMVKEVGRNIMNAIFKTSKYQLNPPESIEIVSPQFCEVYWKELVVVLIGIGISILIVCIASKFQRWEFKEWRLLLAIIVYFVPISLVFAIYLNTEDVSLQIKVTLVGLVVTLIGNPLLRYSISKYQELEESITEDDDDDWVTNEIHFSNFANISWAVEEESYEFSCFGHNWCLVAVNPNNDNYPHTPRGMIGMYLRNTSVSTEPNYRNISIEFSLTIRNSRWITNGMRVPKVTFTRLVPSYGFYSVGTRYLMNLFCLMEDGTLVVDIKMKLAEELIQQLDHHEVETSRSHSTTMSFNTSPSSFASEDCPICLEPISQPWGVVTPCGHPCHVSCWDQVVTRHQRSDVGWESDDEALPSCVVCRKRATGFQQVYLDLGSTGTSGDNKDRVEEEESSEQGSSSSEESRQRRTSSVVGDRPRPLGSLPSENGSTRNRLLQAILGWRRTRR